MIGADGRDESVPTYRRGMKQLSQQETRGMHILHIIRDSRQVKALQERQGQLRLAWILLIASMLVYMIWMGTLTVLRYETFTATAFDLGNLDQVIWNTIHGRPFALTNQGVDWYGPPTRLGFHVEPILLPLSLLYLFHADPRILLIFQTIVLALGAIPVFLLTRKHIPEWPLLAGVMSMAYLCMPALMGLNLFDFHPLSLATPLLLCAVLALDNRRYGWFLLCCVLAACCKEEVPLAVAMLGVLVIWKYRMPRLGVLMFIVGAFWTLFAFAVIMPHFNYPGALKNNYWYRYVAFGSSPGAAVVNILLHPWLLFALLALFVTLDRFYYLLGIFRSTGFLALLAPEWLLPALPSFAINLLSSDALLYSGVYHYNAIIISFVMIAAIHGTRRFIRLWQRLRGEEPTDSRLIVNEQSSHPVKNRVMLWLTYEYTLRDMYLAMVTRLESQHISFAPVGATVTRTTQAFTPVVRVLSPRVSTTKRIYKGQQENLLEHIEPFTSATSVARLQWFVCLWIVGMFLLNWIVLLPEVNVFLPTHPLGSREQHIQHLLNMIPPDASVSASQNINPHVSERQYITVFPAITYSTSKNNSNTVQYIIVDMQDIFPEDQVDVTNELNQLVKSGQFRNLARAEGVILLVRNDT